jgi:hypothetical protein
VAVRPLRVVAVLETMWDWRGMTSGAGHREALRFFRINPDNHSGKRLYKLVGENAQLLVTNACRELASHAGQHGKPDPAWLAQNLAEIELNREDSVPIDLLLVCGNVARATFAACGYKPIGARVMEIPHPAARTWTAAQIAQVAEEIRQFERSLNLDEAE